MLRRLFGSERSQSVVEFSVALPILLLLACGIVDFGIGYGTYVEVRNAAREGARYAVIGSKDGSFPADCTGSDRESVVGQVCTKLNGLDLDNVQDVDISYPEGHESGSSVVVGAEYRYELVTPLGDLVAFFSGGEFPGFFDLSARSDMRLE